MNLKKSNKRFVISSEAKNSKGFRVRTDGIDISRYQHNPVLLFDHDPQKILGNGVELAFSDNKLYGVPAFDTSDTFAESIYHKVENGTIRMASAGLMPLKWKKDQNGELWLWECYLKEFTVTLFGSNPESLAVSLYDEEDNIINLSDDYFNSVIPTDLNKSRNMKTINLNASLALPMVKLTDGATPEDYLEAVQGLVTLADQQKSTITKLTEEKAAEVKLKEKAETELKQLQDETDKAKLVALADKYVAEGRMTADEKVNILGDEAKKIVGLSYEQAEAIYGVRPANPSIQTRLTTLSEGEKAADAELLKLTWSEADKQGKLATLKEKYNDHYQTLGKAHFGDRWTGK